MVIEKNHTKIVAKRNINIVTPRRSKYEFVECDNATMLRRGGLPLFIAPCGVGLIVVRAVRRLLQLYISVRKYKQRKIATELHRPKWVSLPLVDAILRDDVLMLFITPPEFQTDPIYD